MDQTDTLLLSRGDVAALLTMEECISAVEQAFCLYAQNKAKPPKVLGLHTENGGFHIKAGVLGLHKPYFVAKINANFPGNPKGYGLPTIQGIIVVCDGIDGRLLCLMDSIEITILRTGAATAIAAKYLAPQYCKTVTIVGCGNQGKISLRALMKVRKIENVFVTDIDQIQSDLFVREMPDDIKATSIPMNELQAALRESQICITCTPSKKPFIHRQYIVPGTFIAAVGADSEEKQELCPDLVASSKLVVDMTEQCASFGELHHAIKQSLATTQSVHAELGQIIAGQVSGRVSESEIIIFDSTGTGLQDVASAAIVYEKALATTSGIKMNFVSKEPNQPFQTDLKKSQKTTDLLKIWCPFR